jgi:hypothetical protein
LVKKKADLSTPLTITSQREKVIDFTKPIMSLGIAVLYKHQPGEKKSFFSFLSPLSFETWISLICAYLSKNNATKFFNFDFNECVFFCFFF